MGGRQAQIKVNKCWGGTEISRHMPDCCSKMCAEAETLHAPSSLSPLSSSIYTRAISHGVQSLKEEIVLSTSTEQFTTMHSFMQGCWCPQQIPLSVQPQCCQSESSGRGLTVSLFWWFLFVGISIFRISRKNIITKAKKMKWTMFTGQHCKNSVEETILMAETFVSATSSTQH